MSGLLIANCVYPILAIVAMSFISHKNRVGFLIFVFVEILVFYIGYNSKQYGIMGMTIPYLGMYLYSYKKWG